VEHAAQITEAAREPAGPGAPRGPGAGR